MRKEPMLRPITGSDHVQGWHLRGTKSAPSISRLGNQHSHIRSDFGSAIFRSLHFSPSLVHFILSAPVRRVALHLTCRQQTCFSSDCGTGAPLAASYLAAALGVGSGFDARGCGTLPVSGRSEAVSTKVREYYF